MATKAKGINKMDMSLDQIIAIEGITEYSTVSPLNKPFNRRKRLINGHSDHTSVGRDGKTVHKSETTVASQPTVLTTRIEISDDSEPNRSRFHFDRNCGQIFVQNLKYEVNDDDLRLLFYSFGDLRRVAINYLSDGRSAGTGFVVFNNKADAIKAYNAINGLTIDGRVVDLTWITPHERYDRQRIRRIPKMTAPSVCSTSAQFSTHMTMDCRKVEAISEDLRQFRAKRFKN